MAHRILHARATRVLVPAAYVAATVALFVSLGIPYQRDILAVWVILGLLCFSLADLRGSVRGIVLELLPFIAILIAYDSLRGTAGRLFARPLSAPARRRPLAVRRQRPRPSGSSTTSGTATWSGTTSWSGAST